VSGNPLCPGTGGVERQQEILYFDFKIFSYGKIDGRWLKKFHVPEIP